MFLFAKINWMKTIASNCSGLMEEVCNRKLLSICSLINIKTVFFELWILSKQCGFKEELYRVRWKFCTKNCFGEILPQLLLCTNLWGIYCISLCLLSKTMLFVLYFRKMPTSSVTESTNNKLSGIQNNDHNSVTDTKEATEKLHTIIIDCSMFSFIDVVGANLLKRVHSYYHICILLLVSIALFVSIVEMLCNILIWNVTVNRKSTFTLVLRTENSTRYRTSFNSLPKYFVQCKRKVQTDLRLFKVLKTNFHYYELPGFLFINCSCLVAFLSNSFSICTNKMRLCYENLSTVKLFRF